MNLKTSPMRRASLHRERGLTLVELMVAMTIGLLIIAATTGIFVNSSAMRRQIESSAEVIESGRYALDLLSRELAQTGYYGTLSTPTGTTKDLCSTNPAVWADSLALYAVGLNNAEADPLCLNRKAGTDAVFIQRASTCTVADGGKCAEDAAYAYIQVSECGDEYSVTPFVVAKGTDAALKLQTRACDGTPADKRKLVRRIYYISPTDVLSYVEINQAGTASVVVELVENIEQMQIEYAVDSNSDGTPDEFKPVPADWSQVIGMRVWLLARSTDTSAAAKNALDIQMSDTNIAIAAAASNFKRRVYSTYIPFTTPKSRRES
jgi:type IV pilus assembly protein PilW